MRQGDTIESIYRRARYYARRLLPHYLREDAVQEVVFQRYLGTRNIEWLLLDYYRKITHGRRIHSPTFIPLKPVHSNVGYTPDYPDYLLLQNVEYFFPGTLNKFSKTDDNSRSNRYYRLKKLRKILNIPNGP